MKESGSGEDIHMGEATRPGNQNSRSRLRMTMLADVAGVQAVPMCSTEERRVQKLMNEIKKTADLISTEIDPENAEPRLAIEIIQTATEDADSSTAQPLKPIKKPKGCEHIAEFLGKKGNRHLELVPKKILSIEEVHKELMALSEWEITFYSVLDILLKRWFLRYPIYFQDRQVATLTKFLEVESDRKKVLDLLKTFEFGASYPYF
ncbi:hypothetical protein IT413_03085 [Candidatus Peregrinibacteria bacterium]|nr:hypothetical protein [Candidatus Peregrinibacteria bacterium]